MRSPEFAEPSERENGEHPTGPATRERAGSGGISSAASSVALEDHRRRKRDDRGPVHPDQVGTDAERLDGVGGGLVEGAEDADPFGIVDQRPLPRGARLEHGPRLGATGASTCMAVPRVADGRHRSPVSAERR